MTYYVTVFIPLGYLYSVINKEVSLNPSKNEWILIITTSFGGTIIAFIASVIQIRKKRKKDSGDKIEEKGKVK